MVAYLLWQVEDHRYFPNRHLARPKCFLLAYRYGKIRRYYSHFRVYFWAIVLPFSDRPVRARLWRIRECFRTIFHRKSVTIYQWCSTTNSVLYGEVPENYVQKFVKMARKIFFEIYSGEQHVFCMSRQYCWLQWPINANDIV